MTVYKLFCQSDIAYLFPVQQPDNFHFYSFGKTQLKFSIVEKAIFVTNIREKHSNLIPVESYDHGEHTTVNVNAF